MTTEIYKVKNGPLQFFPLKKNEIFGLRNIYGIHMV